MKEYDKENKNLKGNENENHVEADNENNNHDQSVYKERNFQWNKVENGNAEIHREKKCIGREWARRRKEWQL